MITNFNQYIKKLVNTNQMFTNHKEIKDWLDKMNIRNYTINSDLTVDVDGNINIRFKNLKYIPVKFRTLKGILNCSFNNLKSFDNLPTNIGSDFYCSNNKFTSFINSPKEVKGNIYCSDNRLSSLEGLSPYNLMKNINMDWYKELNDKIKEDYFDNQLEDNPELINYINFSTSNVFKDKWEHLLNATKFNLI